MANKQKLHLEEKLSFRKKVEEPKAIVKSLGFALASSFSRKEGRVGASSIVRLLWDIL